MRAPSTHTGHQLCAQPLKATADSPSHGPQVWNSGWARADSTWFQPEDYTLRIHARGKLLTGQATARET